VLCDSLIGCLAQRVINGRSDAGHVDLMRVRVGGSVGAVRKVLFLEPLHFSEQTPDVK